MLILTWSSRLPTTCLQHQAGVSCSLQQKRAPSMWGSSNCCLGRVKGILSLGEVSILPLSQGLKEKQAQLSRTSLCSPHLPIICRGFIHLFTTPWPLITGAAEVTCTCSARADSTVAKLDEVSLKVEHSHWRRYCLHSNANSFAPILPVQSAAGLGCGCSGPLLAASQLESWF